MSALTAHAKAFRALAVAYGSEGKFLENEAALSAIQPRLERLVMAAQMYHHARAHDAAAATLDQLARDEATGIDKRK